MAGRVAWCELWVERVGKRVWYVMAKGTGKWEVRFEGEMREFLRKSGKGAMLARGREAVVERKSVEDGSQSLKILEGVDTLNV